MVRNMDCYYSSFNFESPTAARLAERTQWNISNFEAITTLKWASTAKYFVHKMNAADKPIQHVTYRQSNQKLLL